MKIRVIDWTRTPGPRYGGWGEYSGEQYRKDVVAPAFRECLSRNKTLTVDLEGPRGYGPSWLDEAFAGLINKEGFNKKDVLRLLELESPTRPWFIEDAMRLIHKAQ